MINPGKARAPSHQPAPAPAKPVQATSDEGAPHSKRQRRNPLEQPLPGASSAPQLQVIEGYPTAPRATPEALAPSLQHVQHLPTLPAELWEAIASQLSHMDDALQLLARAAPISRQWAGMFQAKRDAWEALKHSALLRLRECNHPRLQLWMRVAAGQPGGVLPRAAFEWMQMAVSTHIDRHTLRCPWLHTKPVSAASWGSPPCNVDGTEVWPEGFTLHTQTRRILFGP